MQIRWLTVFLDFPATEFGNEVTFWRAIAGTTVSPPRGERREFATLQPFNGDPHIRVQRVESGLGGIHLDLHVDDLQAATLEAFACGATSVADHSTHRVLRSPAGFTFCLVEWDGNARRSRPIRWPGDAISIIDQVCIDIPAEDFDREAQFWSELSGQPLEAGERPEYVGLRRDPKLAVGILLQRMTSPGDIAAHLDLATSSVGDEVARHQEWGAVIVETYPMWTVMRDPTGRTYCITDRNPRTGTSG